MYRVYIVYISCIVGENICLIWTSFDIIFSTVSLLHLIIICTDRYIAISRPLSYSKKSTRRAITVLLVAAWILPTIAAAAKTIKSKSVILFNLKLSQYCMPGDRKLAARIVITIILFIMPTVAVIAMYGRIVYILRQKNLKIGIQYPRSESPKPGNIPNGETDNNVDGLNRNHVQEKTNTSKLEPHTARNLVNASQSEINIARTKRIQGLVSAVILLYLICWSPVFTLMLLQAAGLDVNYTLLAVCHWLGAVNAALNPWLYGFMNRDIRKVLCNIVCCRKSNMNSSSG